MKSDERPKARTNLFYYTMQNEIFQYSNEGAAAVQELTIRNVTLAEMQFDNSLFFRFMQYTDVKETTLKGYAVCVRQFIRWMQEHEIRQPNRDDVRAYKAHLDNQNFTAGTRAQYLRAVKHFFKWTASEGLYPNIADNIKGAKVKQDNTKKEAFNEEDIKTILASIDRTTEAGKRDFAMILLSVTGGLRIIEMQRADVQDIATIRGQQVLYIQGKGRDEKDEYVKLIPEVFAAINEYLQSRPAYKKSDPLFTGTSNRGRGQRMAEPSISRIIKGVFRNAGYDSGKLTAHSLRHTCSTLLRKSGADVYTIQQHVRHNDPKTTEIYIHAADREKKRNEQAIYNQIFNPGKKSIAEQATEALEGLTEAEQRAALDYILTLQKNGVTAERGA